MENSVHTKYLYILKIVQPNTGEWRLTSSSSSQEFNYDIRIQSKSSVICRSTLQKEMESNTDSSGYTKLTTEPVIDSNLFVLTTCNDLLLSNVNISLINSAGNTIASYASTQSGQFGTLTSIRVPQEQFRIHTIITLTNGTKIQRIEKQLISPSSFSIELRNRPRILAPGETINMSYTIKSAKAGQVTVRLQIIDTWNLINKVDIERDITFVNETSGVQLLTLPSNSQPKSTTNLVVFSVSTQNIQTKKFLYENDEIESIYLDISSDSMIRIVHYPLILFHIFLYQMY